MSCNIVGDLYVVTPWEHAAKIVEAFKEMRWGAYAECRTLAYGGTVDVHTQHYQGLVTPKESVVVFVFEGECGYLASDLELFSFKILDICNRSLRGHLISDDGETQVRLEVEQDTGFVTEECCNWVLEYPNAINRELQQYADELVRKYKAEGKDLNDE